mgnify:CR=1 FL=1
MSNLSFLQNAKLYYARLGALAAKGLRETDPRKREWYRRKYISLVRRWFARR